MSKNKKDGELSENAVIRKYRITASDGKNYNTLHYNLQNSTVSKTEIVQQEGDIGE